MNNIVQPGVYLVLLTATLAMRNQPCVTVLNVREGDSLTVAQANVFAAAAYQDGKLIIDADGSYFEDQETFTRIVPNVEMEPQRVPDQFPDEILRELSKYGADTHHLEMYRPQLEQFFA